MHLLLETWDGQRVTLQHADVQRPKPTSSILIKMQCQDLLLDC